MILKNAKKCKYKYELFDLEAWNTFATKSVTISTIKYAHRCDED